MACNIQDKQLRTSIGEYLSLTGNNGSAAGFFQANPSIPNNTKSNAIFRLNKALKAYNGINGLLESSAGLGAVINYVNQQGGAKDFRDLIRAAVGGIDPSMDFYAKQALAQQKAAQVIEKAIKAYHGDPEGKGQPKRGSWIQRTTSRLGLSLDDIQLYFAAQSAKEKNARGREIALQERDNLYAYYMAKVADAETNATRRKYNDLIQDLNTADLPVMKGGMLSTRADMQVLENRLRNARSAEDRAELQDIIDNVLVADEIIGERKYSGKEQDLRDAYLEFKDIAIKPGLDEIRNSGLIKQEAYDNLLNGTRDGNFTNFDWYLPFIEDKTFQDIDSGSKSERLVGRTIKGLTSREGRLYEKRFEPLSTALAHLHMRSTAAQNNIAKRTMGEVFQTIDDPAVKVQKSKFKVQVTPEGGINARPIESLESNNSITYFDEDGDSITITFDPIEGFDEHPLVTAFRYPIPTGKTASWIKSLMNPFRQAFTNKNPAFPPVNFIKDTQAALINLTSVKKELGVEKLRRKYLSNLGQVIRNSVKDRAAFNSLQQEAAEQGVFINFSDLSAGKDALTKYQKAFSTKAMDKEIRDNGFVKMGRRRLKAVGDLLDAYSDYFENINRMAIYKALVDSNIDPQSAAFAAREATLNFERKGKRIGGLSAGFLFINAGIQDVRRSSEILFNNDSNGITYTNPSGKTKRLKFPSKQAAAVSASLFALGTVTRTIKLAFEDEEEDNDILRSSFESNNYMILPAPFFGGTNIKIPKPYTIFRAPFSLGEYAADVAFGRKKVSPITAMGIFAGSVIQSIDPIGASDNLTNLAPFLLRPAVQVITNTNWAGGEVLNSYIAEDTTKKNFEKTYKNSTQIGKSISEGLYNVGIGRDNTTVWATPVAIDYLIKAYLQPGVVGDIDQIAGSLFFKSEEGDVGTLTNALDKILLSDDEVTPGIFLGSGDTEVKSIPVVKRFISITKENENKLGFALDDIQNNLSDNLLTKKDYDFVKRALDKVKWKDSTRSRFEISFQKKFGERIDELGLPPLRKIGADGRAVPKKKSKRGKRTVGRRTKK